MATKRKVWKPRTLKEVREVQTLIGTSNYCFVSGGTWLRTQWEAKLKEMPLHLISLEDILEMKKIREVPSSNGIMIKIGALSTLSDCIENQFIKKYVQTLFHACKRIAAPSIRHQGTIGGNIMTAVGDTIPALLIYQTKLNWFDGEKVEAEPLEKWLTDFQINPHSKNRILIDIEILVEKEFEKENFSFFTKIGRRETFTPAIISVAGKGKIQPTGQLQNVALAVGGGTVLPRRLYRTELELETKKFSVALIQKVHKIIKEEYETNGDTFHSISYKKTVAANLITCELIELIERFEEGGEIYASEM
ncbi:FAD binding domain-containing protein [Alkalihalobacillus sp. BA299]|uniref:FAD binding domain-containing protein n=1 Tax=Alkalihalobacillus sp. BA299 TaxID=2815938 RepID=UPI001ADA27B5|nr:FAD binding domain-containing protein [Alkalihalobacillus sp. BA299]